MPDYGERWEVPNRYVKEEYGEWLGKNYPKKKKTDSPSKKGKKIFLDPVDGKEFTSRGLAKKHMHRMGHKGAVIVTDKESPKVQQGALIYKDKYTDYTYEIPPEIKNHFLKLGILHEFMSLTIILNQVYVEVSGYIEELRLNLEEGNEKVEQTLSRLEHLRDLPVKEMKNFYSKTGRYEWRGDKLSLEDKVEATLYTVVSLLGSMLGTPIFVAKAIIDNTLKDMVETKYNDAKGNKTTDRALLIYNLLNEMFKYNSKFDYTIGGKDIINPFITALPLLAYSNCEIIIRLDNTKYPKILLLDNSIEGLHYSYNWTLNKKYWTLERNIYEVTHDFDEGYFGLGTHILDDESVAGEMNKSDKRYPYLFARIWKRPLSYIMNWMGANPFEEEVLFEDYEIEKPEGHGPRTDEEATWGYKGTYYTTATRATAR